MSQLSFKVRTPPERPRQVVEVPFWVCILICILLVLIIALPAIIFLLATAP